MAVRKVLRVTINFLKNTVSYYIEQKTLKQVIPITYTLEKRFVAAVAFEGLPVVSFLRQYKKSSILWSA